jgi:RNA polymerase sigma-70 factor (ECF subfamily)
MWFGRTSDDEQARAEEALLQAGFRFALSLTHHTHDAEDLTQQSWLNLVRRHGHVRSKSILFRAIRNLFYDQYRRGKIVVFEPLEDNHAELAANDGNDSAPTKDDLDVLLAGLRAAEREALFLNCVEGYTAEEIAKLTGQPRGTVLSLLARARQKLRRVAAEDSSQQRPNP